MHERMKDIIEQIEKKQRRETVLLCDGEEIHRAKKGFDEAREDVHDILDGLKKHKAVSIPPCESFEYLSLLGNECPELSEYISAARDYINAANLNNFQNFYLNHLLLVGKPGTGKTHSAKKLAEALGLEFFEISLSDAQDGFFLVGSQRGFSNSTPGRISERMGRALTANPVILIDELDKVSFEGTERSTGSLSPVLKMLERDTAKKFHDLSLDVSIDLSRVTFIFTANSLEKIPDSIQSRLDVIEVGEPSGEDLVKILPKMLKKELSEMSGRSERTQIDVDPDSSDILNGYNFRDVKRKCRELIVHKLKKDFLTESLFFTRGDVGKVIKKKEKRAAQSFGFISNSPEI